MMAAGRHLVIAPPPAVRGAADGHAGQAVGGDGIGLHNSKAGGTTSKVAAKMGNFKPVDRCRQQSFLSIDLMHSTAQ